MQQTDVTTIHRAPWPAAPALTAEQAASFRRYEALSAPERDRVCRLVAQSGCSIDQACAAIEALRK